MRGNKNTLPGYLGKWTDRESIFHFLGPGANFIILFSMMVLVSLTYVYFHMEMEISRK